jgi:hypothetical protein
MRDIVDRLRNGICSNDLMGQAANLIETLRKERDDALDKARLHQTDAAVAWKEVEALRAGNQWRPIETAPKDGTFIDLWVGDRVANAKWSNGEWQELELEWEWMSWQAIGVTPTHWMPLPPPPALAQPVDSGNNGGKT